MLELLNLNNERLRWRRLLGHQEPQQHGVPPSDGSSYDWIPNWLSKLGQFAGLSPHELRNRLRRCTIATVVLGGVAVLIPHFLPIILLGLWWTVELLLLKQQSHQRALAFEQDYPALLLALASSVKTGLDPIDALRRSTALFSSQSVLRTAITAGLKQLDRGASEAEFIDHFGQAIDHPDISLFQAALRLARREGASLSACLQRLAKVTRNRQSFRRQVRGALAMQRLSAIGIGVCAVVIGIMQFLSNPEAMQLAWQDDRGRQLLILGIALILAGLAWVMRLAQRTV